VLVHVVRLGAGASGRAGPPAGASGARPSRRRAASLPRTGPACPAGPELRRAGRPARPRPERGRAAGPVGRGISWPGGPVWRADREMTMGESLVEFVSH
jgi:hypothetical protein